MHWGQPGEGYEHLGVEATAMLRDNREGCEEVGSVQRASELFADHRQLVVGGHWRKLPRHPRWV